MGNSPASLLLKIYKCLYSHYGPQRWWPAKSRFEIIIGAVLTQNTNWKNVEKAIGILEKKGLLSYTALSGITRKRLAPLIRPSGYFNIKADRIKCFLDFLAQEYGGNLNQMLSEEAGSLRSKLLKVRGIGPETADSILLYAAGRPIFVVDAYTKRILGRHGILEKGAPYDQVQALFMNNLKPDVQVFNEYHALLVRLGKEQCTPTPRCEECPLKGY